MLVQLNLKFTMKNLTVSLVRMIIDFAKLISAQTLTHQLMLPVRKTLHWQAKWNNLLKWVIKYLEFYLGYLYLWYFSSILYFYYIRKDSVVKQTSYLNWQTLITYTPVIILAPWCVWCTFNISSAILFQVLSHLTYFSHIVTLNSYFPTMLQSTGTLKLAESNIQHILFTNCVLYNISNCTQWLTIVYYHLEFNTINTW